MTSVATDILPFPRRPVATSAPQLWSPAMDENTSFAQVEQAADELAKKIPRGFVASVERQHNGQIVRVSTRPLRATDAFEMKQCHDDILAIFHEMPAGRRLTGPSIVSALIERDNIHGESTIAQALADLHDWGFLGNRHDPRDIGCCRSQRVRHDSHLTAN